MTDKPAVGKIRNISGQARTLPWLGDRLVLDGQVVEVPAEDVTAYTQQEAIWEPVGQVATDPGEQGGVRFPLGDEEDHDLLAAVGLRCADGGDGWVERYASLDSRPGIDTLEKLES